MPRIAIITINYNNREGLERTFQSVFSQTYKEFEYIVIDGGSTDGSKELIEKHSREITYWVSEQDRGIYNAMNKGIQKAKGEYLLFLNSGDLFYNLNSLSDNFDFIKHYDIIYFKSIIENNRNIILKSVPAQLDFSFFYYSNLNHQTVFHRKELFNKYGLYDENLKICSDWKFLILSICKFNSSYTYIDKPLTVFVTGGISNDKKNSEILAMERREVLKENFAMFLYIFESLVDYKSKANYYMNSRRVKFLRFFKILK